MMTSRPHNFLFYFDISGDIVDAAAAAAIFAGSGKMNFCANSTPGSCNLLVFASL